PAPAIVRQPLSEQEVRPAPGVAREAMGRGALDQRARRAQLVLRSGEEQASPAGPFGDQRIRGRAEATEQVRADAAVLLLLAEKQAHLGVASPGLVFGRVGIERLPPGDPRLFPAS